MKIREDYDDKDKVYKYSERDYKYKGETHRKREDAYLKYGNRGYKHKEDRHRDDVEWEHRHKTGRARDDINRKKRSREHTSDFESENLKDGSHRHTNNLGRSPFYVDRAARHKDNKDVRRDNSKKSEDETSDYRSRSVQDQHFESKRYMSDANIDPNFERVMSSPRDDDMEITANHSRQRSSLNCKYYPSRDHYRFSKQEETVHEKRSHHNLYSNNDLPDQVCIDDLSAKKLLKSDSQLSPSSEDKLSSHLPPQPPFNKSVEHDLGSSQSNWNNFSNWPYMPFHHVPSPMFNPFMYQYLPPMLGVPPMNMNYATMPCYFTGDTSGNWDHGRNELNNQSWESNVVSVDLQSAVQKNEDLVHGHTSEVRSVQSDAHIEIEENNLDFNTPEVIKVTESSLISMVEKDHDTLIPQVYLSKIDVSKDLTRPELYEQCTSMLLDLDKASLVSDECDRKILCFEVGAEDDMSNGASPFAAADDSVFKKAMSLYTKHMEPVTAMGPRSVKDHQKENIEVDHSVGNQEKESCAPSIGNCEVKVGVNDSCNDYDGRKEVDKPGDGGSLLVLTHLSTSDLTEPGSVNASGIHSPESTH
ncbi:hypothetical protein QVD17_01904 [Tagetes erecta]|uniref:Uncharacterized protein n=1 Tax=Tagetes erecta TaxID=13708 RepID=A0AAD8P797_TARER|nr:hypothetical protein QVD17_01904 [Tagetes erecta]